MTAMDWELLRDGLSWAMLLGGAAFSLIGGLGILRMPDIYTRMHAASLTDTMGAILILGGLMIQGGLTLVTAKLVLTLFFLLFTSPVSTHALAAAALTDTRTALQARDDGTLAPTEVDLPDDQDALDIAADEAARQSIRDEESRA
ncbi:Na(+) H(+) antiporter subunit G [Caenispirillum salinarum AK4]|uniref:Na(+) H(+) antiporter subunit G n=2 Tax=Caenispirillum TaxID=414051 RepID=K9HKJ8_9PROT|nr:Na(+) H(+) antiporter subunit G [Caenispirillum salinarum AK4]